MAAQIRVDPSAAGRLPSLPLHDPGERALAHELGGWQVRTFAWNDPKHRYFAARGLLHLQLWSPERGVSVLTPSLLTDKRYELFVGGERRRLCCYGHLARLMVDELDLYPPCPCAVRRLESALVWAPTLGATQKVSP